MLKYSYFLITALLILSCTTEKTINHQISLPTSRIEGLVYENDAKTPIPGVPVMAYDKYGCFVSGNVTNTRGRYSISNLIPGEYIVRIHSGEYGTGGKYAGEYYKNAYIWENSNPVNVKNTMVTTGINFLLDKGTTLTGKIVEQDTKVPLTNTMFFMKIYTSKEEYITYFNQTDSLGNYLVNGIEPGKYRISIEPDECVGRFYSDTMITIKSTFDTVSGINFEAIKGGVITGKITPITQAWIQVIGTSKSLEKQVDSVGNYIISGLPSGKYIVRVYPFPKTSQYAWKYWQNANSEMYATPVKVQGKDTVKNIDFNLEDEGIISGIVKDKNGLPLENCDFELYDTCGERLIEPTVSQTSGRYYEIHNLPQGEYILKVTSSYFNKNFHGKYYKDTYQLETARKINVKSGHTTSDINFELDPAGSIQGFVLCNNALMSGDSIRFNIIAVNIQTNEIFSTKTTFTGGYKILGVPKGEYKLCTFAPETEFAVMWAGGGSHFNDKKNSIISVTGVDPIDFNLSVVPRTSQISGKVYDADKTLISGGKVTAYDSYGYITQIADIGPEGYILKGLPSGKYFIKTYNLKGYKDKWFNNSNTIQLNKTILWTIIIPPNATPVEVTEDKNISGIDFEL